MKQIVILAALITLSASSTRVQGQEHAPMAPQCQADKAVWIDQLTPSDISKVAFVEVTSRMWEMAECQTVDPPNSAGYVKVSVLYLMAMDSRYQNFVKRHNLTAQFIQEDQAGER